jgi:hypothetical protein
LYFAYIAKATLIFETELVNIQDYVEPEDGGYQDEL